MAKILVVEDDDFFASAICDIVKGAGHQVVRAENGKVAIDIINKEQIDCVFTDVQMPIMSGIELALWLQSNKPLPLIIMTGYSDNMSTSYAQCLNASMPQIYYLNRLLKKTSCAVWIWR